jgi:hypothetical protein
MDDVYINIIMEYCALLTRRAAAAAAAAAALQVPRLLHG